MFKNRHIAHVTTIKVCLGKDEGNISNNQTSMDNANPNSNWPQSMVNAVVKDYVTTDEFKNYTDFEVYEMYDHRLGLSCIDYGCILLQRRKYDK